MPTKRRKVSPKRISIPAAAVEAWRRGDRHRLHQALGLYPFQMSPLQVDPERPPADRALAGTMYAESWHRACELRVALIEIAGEPPDKPVEEVPTVVGAQAVTSGGSKPID